MFCQNDTEKSLTLSTTDDTVDDDGEKVRLGFTVLPALVKAGNPNQATVSITDNDLPQVNVSFGKASYTAAEGGSAAVKVVLSADPERTAEVPITATDINGATAADYSGVLEKVTFQSIETENETEKTFSFAATQDSVDDDGEKVRLPFGTLPTEVTSTAPSHAVVSITDDAAAGVSVDPTTVTMNEGESKEYTVVLDSEPIAGVTVTVAAPPAPGPPPTRRPLPSPPQTGAKSRWSSCRPSRTRTQWMRASPYPTPSRPPTPSAAGPAPTALT